MAALVATALGLVAQQKLLTEGDGVNYAHTEGPFRATVTADGAVQLGNAITALHRGETFGWTSTFCVAPQTEMLMQARLVRLSDNAVALYRERALPPDARGCSSAAWDIVLPPDTPPGRYQLQRFLLLTPRERFPHTHILPPLSIDIQP